MNLRGIVSVSGKPGLFKLIGQNKSGFVLESLDDQKLKIVVNMSNSKMASLEDITIFGDDEDIRLPDVFEAMKGQESTPDIKSDGKVLREFFRTVAPNHDEDRVYASDIKKIISWYAILKELPLFEEESLASEEDKKEVDATVAEEAKEDETKA
jgi:hypothetical protein